MPKPINLVERISIELALSENKSFQEIADILGRSKNGIRMEVMNNGGKDYYQADAAERRKWRVKKEKAVTVSNSLIGKAKDFSIKERLDIIEMKLNHIIENMQCKADLHKENE